MHFDPQKETPASQRHPLEFPANVLASVGTVWIFLIMALVVADVIGRDFLDRPITGVAEFSSRSVGAIVFLQLAAAVCSNRMTRSDFLLNFIGQRWHGWKKPVASAEITTVRKEIADRKTPWTQEELKALSKQKK